MRLIGCRVTWHARLGVMSVEWYVPRGNRVALLACVVLPTRR